jgi:hypothetical protein
MDERENGVWVEMKGGYWLCIAVDWPKRIAAAKSEIEAGMRDAEESAARVSTLEELGLAYGVLLGWQGLIEDDGRIMEFTPERALRAFKEHPEFRKIVSSVAGWLAHRGECVVSAENAGLAEVAAK